MTEYEFEPIRGLPGMLPQGEYILWRGSPDWRMLARHAFHTRLIAGYFALLAVVALIQSRTSGSGASGVLLTAAFGAVGLVLLHVLAWASARTTVYTLTNRRIVMRIGIAVPKCINLPLGSIEAAGLALHADGTGEVPLAMSGAPRLGYLTLWPHARPWRVARPEPMLRCVPDGEQVAKSIARACLQVRPAAVVTSPVSAARVRIEEVAA